MTMASQHPPKMLLLFNHSITPRQEEDARLSLGVVEIIAPPEEVSAIWCGIPPDAEAISEQLAPVSEWISAQAKPGDFILIHGDFGATFIMVQQAIRLGLRPVYSTTYRFAKEQLLEDGSVRLSHSFSHIRFRLYEKA